MGKKISPISGREMVKILEKEGFSAARKRGSHIMLQKGDMYFSVPDHKEITKGTLSDILKSAGISKSEFEKLRQKKRR